VPQAIDRDRLRVLLLRMAEALAEMSDQQIKTKLPALLPPQLRPLAGLLTLPSQSVTRSTMSELATRLSDELSDDEWRSLLQLASAEISMLAPRAGDDDVIRALRKATMLAAQREATSAVAHLREILSG